MSDQQNEELARFLKWSRTVDMLITKGLFDQARTFILSTPKKPDDSKGGALR